MRSSYVPRAHYLYSLKHAPSYDFTEDGIVPLKIEYLDYNTKCKDATRVTLRETSSSTFSSSHISSFLFIILFFSTGMQKLFNMLPLKCLGKSTFWTILQCHIGSGKTVVRECVREYKVVSEKFGTLFCTR